MQTHRNRSQIVQNGGFVILPSLFENHWLSALTEECRQHRNIAEIQEKRSVDHTLWRGSNPDRFLANSQGGSVQTKIYQSGHLIKALAQLLGLVLKPTGSRGSYSYYDTPGHYLGLHRDIEKCDLTLITCLERKDPGLSESGALRVYHNCLKKDLSAVSHQDQFTDFHLKPGESIALLGGYLPHEVLPAAPGFERKISALCFKFQPLIYQ